MGILRILFIGVIGFFIFGCGTIKKSKTKKVLFVVTSHDTLNSDEKKATGAYVTEITHPYEVFRSHGYEIDFVSPKGGRTPLDGMDKLDYESLAVMEDQRFQRSLHNAVRPPKINPNDYQAIYFAGGHGAMFDLPNDKGLQKITKSIYEAGGIVGAVCHGPAGIVNVKLSTGDYLLKGKEVAGFSNKEEEEVDLVEAMPFLLEDRIKDRGAKYTKAKKVFKKHVVTSGRLVTGQNPASAKGVAESMLNLIR